MPNGIPEQFLVAFSLAGEQRELVRAVAKAVRLHLGEPNVFYDEWFEHYIAGSDADLKLQDIYGNRCVLAVLCISSNYNDKPWTRAEHAAIRARYMTARDRNDELGILPLRVGDGDVEGVLFNAIVPDIRQKTVDQAAELIIKRLRLIRPDTEEKPTANGWPQEPPAVKWPMADHVNVRDAFQQMLRHTPPFRFLPIEGPSDMGKTGITKQMLGNALSMPNLACGRFDFKGTTNLDNEVRALVQQLGVGPPPADLPLTGQLGRVFSALRQNARPTLLIFDTYELAGEAQDWVENHLLPGLVREPWLRVVVVGQQAPSPAGAWWETTSSPLLTLQRPTPEDWFAFGRDKPGITLEFVRQVHEYCGGRPSLLAQLLGRSN